MPNIANKKYFESIVPRETPVKHWLGLISDALNLNYVQAHYYYHDKRATELARSRLQATRAKISRVRCKIDTLHDGGNFVSNHTHNNQAVDR